MTNHHHTQNETEKLKTLATYLDAQFQLPFGIKIGWDGIIGLIPGLGDLVTNTFSFYIVLKATTLGCSFSVVLRMLLNILIDNLVDVFPVIGVVLDFAWKSNLKNVQLLENYLHNPDHTRRVSKAIIISFVLLIFTLIMASVFLAGYLFILLFQYLQNSW